MVLKKNRTAFRKRGQFFIVSLLIMVLVIVGVAYFAAESKQSPLQLQVPKEAFAESETASYGAALFHALGERPYNGSADFIADTINDLKAMANRTGRELSMDCDETQDENAFTVDCNITLQSTTQNITRTVKRTYTVPFGVKTYADPAHALETHAFNAGDNVYYRITGNTSEDVNITVKDGGGDVQYTAYKTFTDYKTDDSFAIDITDPTGTWEVFLNDTLKKSLSIS
ncbi:MAG: hypothetical protein JW834_04115 [Candidatus Diapherotrites archaeon]|nr:hypothetical protein [Candidatus Diapherotrites archaeon]